MAILSISSQVSRGYVGNSATLAALHILGVEVWTIPTIILSNHKGYKHCFGTESSPEDILTQFEALEQNGWLGEIDAILTGYMASPEQVKTCAEIVARVKTANDGAFFWCDPVLGDEPGGLYVAETIAVAMARHLVPLADILSPNAFELGWLTGRTIEDADAARKASATLKCSAVMATSIPDEKPNTISNLLVQGQDMWRINHQKFDDIPHGTGDLFTALACGHFLKSGGNRSLQTSALKTALENASSSLFALAKRNAGSRDDNLSLSDIRDTTLSPDTFLKATKGSP